MKKKNIALMMIMVMVMVVSSLSGCGAETAETISETIQNTEETANDILEEAEVEEVKAPDAEADSLAAGKEKTDLNLKEYEYSFEDRSVEKEGEPFFYLANFEDKAEMFQLSDSIDLYAYNGICIGHTKPNISIMTIGQWEDWYYTNIARETRFIKIADVEKAVVAKEEAVEEEVPSVNPQNNTSTATSTAPAPETSTPVNNTPAETASSSDKYTPEEAVAVYRSLMEAGGITWEPSLKNGGSWGTGFLYLDKGYAEWAASTDLESYAMGDSVGHAWTKYYLEVTGSDENTVYITGWHN